MGRKVNQWLVKFWQENRYFILFFGLVIIPIKSSVADWNWVPTGSMKPNILEGDLVFINKAAYDLRVPLTLKRITQYADPDRGDIVVCFSPEDGTRLVKRVVAVPGDEVAMVENRLYINGAAAEYTTAPASAHQGVEPELQAISVFARESIDQSQRDIMITPPISNHQANFAPYTIPTGQFFMVGDNRDNSRDSREIGPIGRHLIIGEAKSVVLSFNKLDKFQPRFSRWFKALR